MYVCNRETCWQCHHMRVIMTPASSSLSQHDMTPPGGACSARVAACMRCRGSAALLALSLGVAATGQH